MTARLTAAQRAEISRQNGRKSRGGGPRTEQGKARSSKNALKHGMTACVPVLPGEDHTDFRRRVDDFIDALRPTNAAELALTEQAALATWKIARGERAAAARVSAALRAAEAAADLGHPDEVAALGHWLTAYDLRSKQEAGKALFPFLSPDRHDPFGRGRGEPRHIVLKLEGTAGGCQMLIDQWTKLRARLDRGVDWRTNELIAALQMLGQRPLWRDAIEWQGWTEPILPEGNPEGIAELRDRMLRQFDADLPDDPADRRAALMRRVDEETERLLERQAGHRRREAADRAELADRLAVDTTPEGELMRRYQLDADRKLDRALHGLVKLRRAGVGGVAGEPAPEGGSEREPEAVGAVEPEGGPADGPEREADAEVPPKAEGDGAGDRDPGACGLPPAFGPDPASNPGPGFVAPAAAVAAGEPAPAGVTAPDRAAAEPEGHPVPPNELSCPAGATRPHDNGWAQGFTSPARCPEGPSPALVRGEGAEGSAPDEPGSPAPGDEARRNGPDPATDGDPIVRNEPCASVDGDPIAPDEANSPAGAFPRPGLLVGAMALLALLLPVSVGHPAIVAAGSDVGRALQRDTDRTGPDSVVGGGSVRQPIGSDRVGGRSPLLQGTRSGPISEAALPADPGGIRRRPNKFACNPGSGSTTSVLTQSSRVS